MPNSEATITCSALMLDGLGTSQGIETSPNEIAVYFGTQIPRQTAKEAEVSLERPVDQKNGSAFLASLSDALIDPLRSATASW